MKSTLNESEKPEAKPEFPKLYKEKSTELVVMFVDEQTGIVVHGNNNGRPRGYFESWIKCTDKYTWEEYNGTVTLEN